MQIEHLNKETTDGTVRNLDALYQLFPSCFTEAKDAVTGKMHRSVDWGKLRELLGEYVETDEPEKYDFTWVGKRAAQREAAAPCRKTLRPCPEESVDWDTTQNLYIEGDNLEVLKLLQNSYMGKVKMIYIDPPYNTGNDFVYHDDFAQSAEEYDEHNRDDEGNRFRKNTDSNGRFHSDWCSMIYARLMVARSLLTEDGVIFISIDDNEQANLKKICDEVFGEADFVAATVWRSSDNSNNDAKQFSNDHNLTLIYSKLPNWQPQKEFDESKRKHYKNPDNDPNGPWFDGNPLNSPNYRPNLIYEIIAPNGNIIKAPKNGWRWSKETLESKMATGEIYFNSDQTNIKRKTYLKDLGGLPPSSLWINLEKTGHNRQAKYELLDLMPEDVFDTPKPLKLIKHIINLVSDNKEAIIMDFFSGSGTTGEAVLQLNALDGGKRKFILVQLQENLDDKIKGASNDKKMVIQNAIGLCDAIGTEHSLTTVSKERLRRAGKKIKADSPLTTQDLDIGFRVLKCDESNYKPVAFAPKDYTQESLDMFLDNIKEERTGLDLLFDCMMRWGLELSLPYDTQKVDGCTIYNVDEGSLVACFDGVVTGAVIDAIAETHPLRVVFRDSSFTEAAQKMNLFELFKQKCGWTDQEVQNNVRVI